MATPGALEGFRQSGDSHFFHFIKISLTIMNTGLLMVLKSVTRG